MVELDALVERRYMKLQNKKNLTGHDQPKSGRFNLFSKIHERSENVPGRPATSNCGK